MATRISSSETTMPERSRSRVDPLVDPTWRELADSSGDLFSSQRWLRVLSAGYGLSFAAEVFGTPSRPTGGVVWAEIDDLRGRRLASLPFSDFTDPIGVVAVDELDALILELTSDGTPLSMRLRAATSPSSDLLSERGRLAWHRTLLAGTEEETWARLKSGARQNVRKAERNDLDVSVASTLDAVMEFRCLHVGLRKSKYRMLAQPTRFFEALAGAFAPDDVRVVTASKGGTPLASVVLLRHGDTAYYKFNASTAEALDVRANDLVMWTAMKEAIEWGCASFDFGVSDLDQPGLIRYKRKYASEEGDVTVLRSETSTPPTRLAKGIGRALPSMTRVLTSERCPDRITSRAGDLLYRHFC